MTLTQWKKSLLNLFYPNRCPVCGTFLDAFSLTCESCGDAMMLGQDDYCHRCGKVACMCKSTTPAYDWTVISCRYAEESIPAIVEMKQSRNTNFADFSARILAERLRDNPFYGGIDCIVPVPMHKSRKRTRGYNQAALIAREIGRMLALPCREDILYKAFASKEQHTLGRDERKLNVDAFRIHDVPLDGLHILLCDDVLTTGSTLSRCAALLKENGAKTVIAAASATTIPKKQEDTK